MVIFHSFLYVYQRVIWFHHVESASLPQQMLQRCFHCELEAIRTLLALGALPEAIKADVWAELQPQDFGRISCWLCQGLSDFSSLMSGSILQCRQMDM